MRQIGPALLTHLQGEVTTICTCIDITRQDGKSFHFTDHDEPVMVGAIYCVPYNSFSRTSIPTTVDLEVDQMEFRGILNNDYVNRAELSAGLFDFADVRVYVVNWQDPTQGQALLRVGTLGEVTLNEDQTFQAEIRGLTQAYTTRIGDQFQPQCRADLGDRQCKVALAPALWQPRTAYAVGDVISAPLGSTDGQAGDNYVNLSFVNGSFDDDGYVALVRDPTGWTSYGETRGRWTIRSTFYNCPARDGQAIYNTDDRSVAGNPNNGASGIGMYQDINLLAQGVTNAAVDTGKCRLHLDLYHAQVNGHVGSTRVKVIGLNAQGVQIGASTLYDSGAMGSQEDVFVPLTVDNVVIPKGVRILRFDLSATKQGKWEEGGGFDALEAAVNLPDGTYRSASLAGQTAFIATTAGVSGAYLPSFKSLIGSTTVEGSISWKAVRAWNRPTSVQGFAQSGRLIIPQGIGEADGYYDGGLISWETGANAGRRQEVKSWVSGALTLFQRPVFPVASGDRFTLFPGCNKIRSTCKAKFSNILNFRGEPDVPGQDAYYTTPNAPEAS